MTRQLFISLLLALPSFNSFSAPWDSLDLASLMAADLQSTSAMKRAQSVQQTAASVYVLSHDEIAQSGVSSIPEALALVPGVQVRRIDQHQWSISIRATGGRFTSKLLVMIDGQSVYNPAFAGVFWESLDVAMYDIERIEVLRGPGGLLWSSNATNGVINIITKHSIDTRGVYVDGKASTLSNGSVSARFGGDSTNDSSYRFYAGYRHYDSLDEGLNDQAHDSGHYKLAGSRFDFNPTDALSIMTQLEWSKVDVEQLVQLPSLELAPSANDQDHYNRAQIRFVSRLEQRYSNTHSHSLQLAFSNHKGQQSYSKESFSYYDIDYQMNLALEVGQLDWGINYRLNHLPLSDDTYIQSNQGIDYIEQYGAFIQYQQTLFEEQVTLTLGNKSEHNSLTEWEHQPSIRLLWEPNEEQVLWAAWSRAVLLPSLGMYDYDIRTRAIPANTFVQPPTPALSDFYLPVFLDGNQYVQSEITRSWEFGYRLSKRKWQLDLALFHSKSDNLLTIRSSVPMEAIEQALILFNQGEPEQAEEIIIGNPALLSMESSGELITRGGELSWKYHVSRQLQAELGVSYSHYQFETPAGTTRAQITEDSTRQLFLTGRYQPSEAHNVYLQLRLEDGEAYQTKDLKILDLNWLWQLSNTTQLNLRGSNLLANEQLQFGHTRDSFTIASKHKSEVSLQLSYQF